MASKQFSYTPENMSTADAFERWVFSEVVDLLHWHGTMRRFVKPEVFDAAYLLCDGFGAITLEIAKEQCYDWSHVRDSSPEAMERVLSFLWADGRVFANTIEPRSRFNEIKAAVSR